MSNTNTNTNTNVAEQTVLLPDSFKGYPIVGVWKVNAVGQKVTRKPLVSFGLQKARALLNHVDEIRAWVEQQEAERYAQSSASPVPLPVAAPASSIKISIDELSNDDVMALKKRLGL